jgi:trans-aconitate methyltransferase
MNQDEAGELIGSAVAGCSGVWAELGAGKGMFTTALRALLPPESRIYAVDSDPTAIAVLEVFLEGVTPILADFSQPFELPETPLDGILMANALHFVLDQELILRRLVKLLRPGGRVVIVEYDRRAKSRWVPFPISADRWLELAPRAGLANPRITAKRPSMYAGELYVGVAERSVA